MVLMGHLRGYSGVLGAVVLALSLITAGCYRPVNLPSDGATAANPAPFQASRDLESESNPLTPGNSPNTPTLPFRDAETLPAGTLLTVHLIEPVAVETPGAKDAFEAILDEPVVVNGNTLVPRGATAAGRVQASRVSDLKPDRGYVRLALESIRIGTTDVPIQTASLFARQIPSSATASTTAPAVMASPVRLEKGRRLTFRLTEEIFLNPSNAQARR